MWYERGAGNVSRMATTPVPAVDRAVKILQWLADSNGGPARLSDISRATEIHKATCAAVLARLVDHGYVHRSERNTFALGPEFVSMAFAYSRRHVAYLGARHEMFALASQTGLSASITVVDGDEMVVLDIAGDAFPQHLPQRVGRRIPLIPPLGTIFKAWADPEELDDWLRLTAAEFDLDYRDQIRVISEIRSRGYTLGSEQDFEIKLDSVMRRIEDQDLDDSALQVALMLADKLRAYRGGSEDGEGHSVDYIGGPIFGLDGRVVMSLQLFGAPGAIAKEAVPSLAETLLAATRRVTASLGSMAV